MTKEKPILFSGAMVRAILHGRKSQTRRMVKPRKDRTLGCELAANELAGEVNNGDYTNSPYAPGDRLWVRETARCNFRSEQPPQNKGCVGVAYQAGGEILRDYAIDQRHAYPWFPSRSHNTDGSMRWAPAIHMPRWASRILLEITGVRVEKLNDCSEADAEAEGIAFLREVPDVDETLTARQLYECLWDSINGAGAWEANPWVWVVEFKRVPA